MGHRRGGAADHRRHRLLLACLIFSGWQDDSVIIISVLVGVSMIISGANRLTVAAAV